MRSTTTKALFTTGLVAILSAPALAQGGGGGYGGGGGGGVNIIANPGVQKELALTAEQASKVSQIADDMRAKLAEARQGFADLDQQERRAKMTALNLTMNEALVKDLGTVLKPEQLKRFKQIEFQQMGAQALASPAIAKELKITDAQAEKVKALLAESMTQTREIMQASQDDRPRRHGQGRRTPQGDQRQGPGPDDPRAEDGLRRDGRRPVRLQARAAPSPQLIRFRSIELSRGPRGDVVSPCGPQLVSKWTIGP